MNEFFTSILIPVDFSVNTEAAVNKALLLAGKGTTIHLLHVQRYLSYGLPGRSLNYFITNNSSNYETAKEKLEQWKSKIENKDKNIRVATWIRVEDNIQIAVEEMARKLEPDVIVIGKNSHHSWLPFLNTITPNKIVQHTGLAVLTLKPGAVDNNIRKVVVPVSRVASSDKKEILSAFCRKFRLKIHLVAFPVEGRRLSELDTSSLLQMYQWLATAHNCPVVYAVLQRKNRARAILEYAEKIEADILLVHPESETKIGWPDKHISDVLPARSKMQVLTVQANPILHH